MNLQHPSDTKAKKMPSSGQNKHSGVVVKILCVLAAFLLWMYVMASESPQHKEIFENVVVRVINGDVLADRGLAVYNGDGTCIDVTLSGKKSVLTQIKAEDLIATANVENYDTSGRMDVSITLDVPDGCKLVEMSSDTVSVYLDYYDSKTVDLSLVMDNISLPEGLTQGAVDVEDYKVTVSGAKKYVEMVTSATAVFDMTGVQKTTQMKTSVDLYDSLGRLINNQYIEYAPRSVELTVPIIKTVTLPVEVQFKYGFFSAENTVMELSAATVTVSGEPDVINRYGDALLQPIVIDEKNDFDTNGVCTKSIQLTAPEGVTYSVDTIELSIAYSDEIMTRIITVPSKNIMDSGAKPGLEYTWDDFPVSVKVMGTLEVLKKITAEDILLWLDMSPYSESSTGTVNVRAKVVFDTVYKDELLEVGTYDIPVTFVD